MKWVFVSKLKQNNHKWSPSRSGRTNASEIYIRWIIFSTLRRYSAIALDRSNAQIQNLTHQSTEYPHLGLRAHRSTSTSVYEHIGLRAHRSTSTSVYSQWGTGSTQNTAQLSSGNLLSCLLSPVPLPAARREQEGNEEVGQEIGNEEKKESASEHWRASALVVLTDKQKGS